MTNVTLCYDPDQVDYRICRVAHTNERGTQLPNPDQVLQAALDAEKPEDEISIERMYIVQTGDNDYTCRMFEPHASEWVAFSFTYVPE